MPHWLATMDWHWLGTVMGGGVVAALSRFLGIAQRMQALENRVDTQGQHMANQLDEIARLRKLVGEQDKALLALQRALSTEKRRSGELADRVAELESQLAASDKRATALAAELRDTLSLAQPSHDTLPPPGAKPR